MISFLENSRTKRLILSIAIVLVSLIYGLPHLIFSYNLGNNYNPLSLSTNTRIARDETRAYAPFVNFILKGNFPLHDVYVEEYKSFPTPFLGETFPALIFAFLAKATGSISNAFIAGDFIFPPMIFLMLFLITRIFIKNTYYCLAVALLTVISRDFISVIPYPLATINYFLGVNNSDYQLYLSRAFHPQITFLILLLAIYCLFKLIHNPKDRLNQILLGIFTGALFYSYIFYWTYFGFFLFILFIYLIYKKNITAIKSFVLPFILACIIGSYYFVSIFYFTQLPFYEDFVTKSSAHSYPFVLTTIRYLIIAMAFFLLYKKKDIAAYALFFLILAGVLVGPLSKLVLGQDLETLHYLRRAVIPLSTLVFFIIVYQLIKNNKALVRIVTVLVCAVAISYGLFIQISTSKNTQKYYFKNPDEEALFSWLNANTKKDDVIGTLDTDLNNAIPVFTKNKVYFPPTDRTIATTDESVKRYIILSTLLGIDKNVQKKKLDSRILTSYLFVYQAYDDDNNLVVNSKRRAFAEEEIDSFDSRNVVAEKNKFKLDYIILTPEDFNNVDIKSYLKRPITTTDKYVLFKLP